MFKNGSGQIIYIGKAKSLRDRVSSYFAKTVELQPKTAQLVSEIATIDHIVVESEIDALLLEANLISKFLPKYNISLKDNKAYPFIEITWAEKIPEVRIVRRADNKKSQYFGPFPVGTNLVEMLHFLRRIFPFVSQKHPKGHACLRSHLGICPCPDIYSQPKALAKYKQDLKNLALFLSGKRETVQKKLREEMDQNAKIQKFEEAAEIKGKLEQIEFLTAARRQAWEYATNPNLLEDKLAAETEELRVLLNLPRLNRIECYDIATLAGKFNSGSRIVFIQGVPEKRLYRHYRIPGQAFPNDVAMMQQILTRRLKNTKDPLPDLFVLDGGLGQLKAAKEAGIGQLPVISLAKQEETILLQNGTEINLPDESPALHLLQKIRDEAHRFSRTYHFWQRRKNMLA